MNLLLALLVTVWVGYFILKRYKPQTILFIGGMVLMLASVLLGYGHIYTPEKSTGFLLFDVFEFIRETLSSRAGKLGLNIMAVAGFARYMDHIGASRALVNLTIQPLLKLKSPYLVMSCCWALGMLLGLAINSASGLAMLLMVTMFPILVALGVSRLSATAAIATTLCLDWSPSDTGTIFAAELAGIDPVIYWHDYQVPIALCVFPVVGILHYFTQKYMDKRDGHVVRPLDNHKEVEVHTENVALDNSHPPLIFAILPLIPLALILVFSPLMIESIQMDIIKAMLIGTAVGMMAQYIRTRNAKEVCEDLGVFFDGMGRQMAQVVTLIVAGETFAKGLMVSGTIDQLIAGTHSGGFGAIGLTLTMTLIIGVCAVVMGSGNAPFFAFANLVPDIAAKTGMAAVLMVLPMHFIASSARAISPITAVIIVASGMAGISSFDLVKRTAIPMIGSCLTVIIMNFVLFL